MGEIDRHQAGLVHACWKRGPFPPGITGESIVSLAAYLCFTNPILSPEWGAGPCHTAGHVLLLLLLLVSWATGLFQVPAPIAPSPAGCRRQRPAQHGDGVGAGADVASEDMWVRMPGHRFSATERPQVGLHCYGCGCLDAGMGSDAPSTPFGRHGVRGAIGCLWSGAFQAFKLGPLLR